MSWSLWLRRGKEGRVPTSSGQVILVKGKPEPCPVCFLLLGFCPGF